MGHFPASYVSLYHGLPIHDFHIFGSVSTPWACPAHLQSTGCRTFSEFSNGCHLMCLGTMRTNEQLAVLLGKYLFEIQTWSQFCRYRSNSVEDEILDVIH